MKQSEVEVGKTYMAKVSGGVVPVRITQEKWIGEKMAGWVGVNTQTNRSVRVKSAQRLRGEASGAAGAEAAATAPDGAGQDATDANDDAPVTAVAAAGSPRPPKTKGEKARASKEKSSAKAAKAAKTKAVKPPKVKRVSGLDAAAQVLAKAKKPMTCGQVMEAIREQGLWKSGGKTPEATLYAAMIREIAGKGKESRFKKVERGLFAATPHAAAAGKEG